jgi:hypothetical protein
MVKWWIDIIPPPLLLALRYMEHYYSRNSYFFYISISIDMDGLCCVCNSSGLLLYCSETSVNYLGLNEYIHGFSLEKRMVILNVKALLSAFVMFLFEVVILCIVD